MQRQIRQTLQVLGVQTHISAPVRRTQVYNYTYFMAHVTCKGACCKMSFARVHFSQWNLQNPCIKIFSEIIYESRTNTSKANKLFLILIYFFLLKKTIEKANIKTQEIKTINIVIKQKKIIRRLAKKVS